MIEFIAVFAVGSAIMGALMWVSMRIFEALDRRRDKKGRS
jgi:hypothetical protein